MASQKYKLRLYARGEGGDFDPSVPICAADIHSVMIEEEVELPGGGLGLIGLPMHVSLLKSSGDEAALTFLKDVQRMIDRANKGAESETWRDRPPLL